MLPKLAFVLGGAASGKSDCAERLVRSWAIPLVYVATAEPIDSEMRQKIADHRARRAGDAWRTVEAPHDLAAAVARLPAEGAALVDCLTVWLGNRIVAGADLDGESAALVAALVAAPCPVCVVSNEVGQGIVPETSMGRRFRAAQGRLNRAVAARADPVIGVMAGLPFALKGALPDALG